MIRRLFGFLIMCVLFFPAAACTAVWVLYVLYRGDQRPDDCPVDYLSRFCRRIGGMKP